MSTEEEVQLTLTETIAPQFVEVYDEMVGFQKWHLDNMGCTAGVITAIIVVSKQHCHLLYH